jgi:hypothetical protein
MVRKNATSCMSLLLKQSQRQRSFLGFAQKASNNVSIVNKMNRENR